PDMLICMDIFAFNHSPVYSADDAKQIVNIVTEQRLGIFGSELVPGARNYQFLGVRHVKVPTEPLILERVLEELRTLADAASTVRNEMTGPRVGLFHASRSA